MAIYKNITTATTTDLISRESKRTGTGASGYISKITICNVDTLQAENVSVFIEDATASASTDASNNKYYFIKDVDIPVGTTLVLEDNLGFNKNVYALRILTNSDSGGGTPSLSITIK